ncbi:MAG: Fe-S cluster assembly protein SufB, partial [Oscillospiraceae bacterium]|nr:Fe-S cluster assembly protein SufB [Oscillospiraceae bacterium]
MSEAVSVTDAARELYDKKGVAPPSFQVQSGLTPEIIHTISDEKRDPDWMREFRLKSLELYHKIPLPGWGPSLDALQMDNIVTYVRPDSKLEARWEDVPEEIKDTFERLGIPEAERTGLAGVGAQYDSEVVYHSIKKEVAESGVVYTDMDSALKGDYADMVRTH